MKWETITSGLGNTAFALLNNGRRLLTLAFHPSSNAARIEFENEKRVFLLRREGFFKNKIVLCNEYGIRIGRVGTDKKNQFIQLDNDRYFFTVKENTNSPKDKEISIYKENETPAVVVYSTDQSADQNNPAQPGMIMVLCWYLFNHAFRVNLAV